MDSYIDNVYCPVCSSEGKLLYYKLKDGIYNINGCWSYMRCLNSCCKHIWLLNIPEDISSFYKNYYTHNRFQEIESRSASLLLKAILKLMNIHKKRKKLFGFYLEDGGGRRLLEIGCGNGSRLAFLKANGWIVDGQEVDTVSANIAAKVADKVYIGELRNCNINTTYDAIVMNHVVEHINNPHDEFKIIFNMLSDDGVIVLITPNNMSLLHKVFKSNWRGIEPPRHINIFNLNSLSKMLMGLNFSIKKKFTTEINSELFFIASLQIKNKSAVNIDMHTCLSFPAVLFQILSSMFIKFDVNSGEECVVVAKKFQDF